MELPIVVTKNWEVASYVQGYHVYKRVWTPISNEVLQTCREPEKPTDKYAVCVLKDGKVKDGKVKDGKVKDGKVKDGKVKDGKVKDGKVVGHLKKCSNGRFAETIF